MNAVIRIWAFLTNGRLIYLRDFDGETALSIAYVNQWGELCAKRFWPFSIRTVRLLPDGIVDGGYVKNWKDA